MPVFCKIWYSNTSKAKASNLHKLAVFWVNYCQKHPLPANLDVFVQNCFTDGWQMVTKIGIEKVKILMSNRHIHAQKTLDPSPLPCTVYMIMNHQLQKSYVSYKSPE